MNKRLNFQELFQGFQNTPELWTSDTIYHLEQYDTKATTKPFLLKSDSKKLRLGKWVEQFVAFQLAQDSSVQIIEENLQIRNNKVTIGELDLLLLKNEQVIHLEIIYKFYLYDTAQKYTNPLDYWIGPNRRDRFIYKLNKLKEKQLPLLYHHNTAEALQHHNIDFNSIKQEVCFKAQLFLPLEAQSTDIYPLNPDCIAGWYLNYDNISILKTHQFFIPEKLEWLSNPKHNVVWHSFEDARLEIQKQIENKQSPMCWIKKDIHKIEKCFITWW